MKRHGWKKKKKTGRGMWRYHFCPPRPKSVCATQDMPGKFWSMKRCRFKEFRILMFGWVFKVKGNLVNTLTPRASLSTFCSVSDKCHSCCQSGTQWHTDTVSYSWSVAVNVFRPLLKLLQSAFRCLCTTLGLNKLTFLLLFKLHYKNH